MGRQSLLRPEPGQRAAAGGAGAGHHLRADGRDQYGAWRAADDRRLRYLCGADAVPRLAAWLAGLVRGGGAAAGLPGHGAGGHGAGTHRDPLALRPAPGNAAGDLGHQPDADAGRAQPVRRAERGGRQSGLDVGRRHGAGRTGAQLQPPGHHRLRAGRGGAGLGLAQPHAPGPVRARHHAEPTHGRLHRRAHRTRGHAGLRPGLGHRRAGRRGAVAAGQCGPGPGARLHRRFVHGGGAGRRGPAGRHRHRRAGPGRRQQIPGTLCGSGHGQDHHPGAYRAVCAEAAAGLFAPRGRSVE